MVIRMKTIEDRREYLAGIEKQRGKAAADRLRMDVLRGWHK